MKHKQQQQIFLDKFGNRTLDAFDRRLLFEFCEYLQNERTNTPPTTKTIKNYKTGISVVLDHATKSSKFDYEKNLMKRPLFQMHRWKSEARRFESQLTSV